ncbi:MAG: exodeoxyribonuclease VII small subunit [Planctomycetes bacterium]|nr:exodeoxyribonuclease VII small subunit [Planctomycetota bacterium]
MGSKAAKPVSFEEHYGRLEEIVRELERGELTLDESLARYEEGVARLKECFARLKDAEAKIVALLEKSPGGTVVEEKMEFRPTDGEGGTEGGGKQEGETEP